MSIKTQPAMLVAVNVLDYAHKLTVRHSNEDPESQEMKDLIGNIKEFGIRNPLKIFPKGNNRFEVIVGNRRLAAAKALRLEYVPATISEDSATRARRWAFADNKARKDTSAIEDAKTIRDLYKDVGIEPETAIRKVRYMYELQNNHPEEYKKLIGDGIEPAGSEINNNRDIDNNRPTKEFLEVYNDIPISGIVQYQLLRTIIKIPEETIKILEKAPGLGKNKAVLLTHSRLKDYPEVIRESLAKQIIDPKVDASKAAHIVNQTIADLDAERIQVTKDGNIDYGYSSGKGYRSDPEENVDTPQEVEAFTFFTELGDINHILMTDIAKILKIKIGTGQVHYDPSQYKPALEKLEKNLETLTKEQKGFCAEQAAIMGRICKTIVDSVK